MFVPENEMGVVVLFSQLCKEHGFEIKSVRIAYPDAIIVRGQIEYRTEFEFVSSNYFLHNHDIRDCDLVICWKHDSEDLAIPVIELSRNDWHKQNIVLATDSDKQIAYWRYRALSAESKLERIISRLEKGLPAIEVKETRKAKEISHEQTSADWDSISAAFEDPFDDSVSMSQMIKSLGLSAAGTHWAKGKERVQKALEFGYASREIEVVLEA